MSATTETRRQALIQDISHILDDFQGGKISYLEAKTSVRRVFETPTCRLDVNDVAPYLFRMLDMVRSGEIESEEAATNIANMEMSFDSGKVPA